MPHFVSFTYFLLIYLRDIKTFRNMQIPRALKSRTSFWSFMYYLAFCWILQHISGFLMCSLNLKSRGNCWNSWPYANEMQDWRGSITVLFSHCVKRKATLDFNKEIRTSLRGKAERESNSALPNSHIWVISNGNRTEWRTIRRGNHVILLINSFLHCLQKKK